MTAKPKPRAKRIGSTAGSVAGEEDPGAALDAVAEAPRASGDSATPPPAKNPGDDAAAGTRGTGEAVCQRCGGSGRVAGALCPTCGGTGKVVHGIGGG